MNAALDVLEGRAESCGLILHRSLRGVGRPGAGTIDEATLEAVARSAHRRASVPVDQARMLYRVARRDRLPNTLGNNDQVSIRSLEIAGIVEPGREAGARFVLSDDASYALCLDGPNAAVTASQAGTERGAAATYRSLDPESPALCRARHNAGRISL